MKKLGLSLAATTLLFTLAGCGFKLDDEMLSKDGGIWKVKDGSDSLVMHFLNDGTVEISDADNVLKKEHSSYTVTKTDKGFSLELDGMTINIPKKDQSDQEFSGRSLGKKVTFVKEDKSYLSDLKKKQEIANKKEEEQKRKEEEARKKELAANRDAVFSKVIASLKPEGISGEGSIDTDDIDISNFNVDDKDLEISSSQPTFEIPNNGSLKNGEKIKIQILDSGQIIYEKEITITGLTEYAKSVKDIKNIDDVKKKMQTFINESDGESEHETIRQAYFYYPKTGKFSCIWESKGLESPFESDIYFEGVITSEGIPLNNGKVSFPTLSEDNTKTEDVVRDSFSMRVEDKEERDEQWNSTIKSITKRGGQQIK